VSCTDTPNTYGGKAFTVFYVPVSVVMVAAAIQRVASVPLKKRALALEDHVLSQFGKSIQPCVSSSPPAAAAAATARAPGLLLLFVLPPPRWCRGSCSDSDRDGDDVAVAAERNDGMMLMMTMMATIIMMT
jgi:hypothetical protein